jgi:hypothetical protein
MEKTSPEVRKSLIKAIKTQLKENNPPEVKQMYIRLLGEDISEKDVYIYLAQALAYEMYAMIKEKRIYDMKNYVKLLARLPNLD